MTILSGKYKREVIAEVSTETPGVAEHGFFKLIKRKRVRREVEGDVRVTVDNDELERLIDLAFKSDEGWASNGCMLVRVLNRVILSEQVLLDR